VQVDYCFPKTREQDAAFATLVAVDDTFGKVIAIPVDKKGSKSVVAVKGLAAFVRGLGQPKVVIQSDSEPAICDVVRQVCDMIPGATPRVTPIASKGSNGRVEQANKAVEGMARTLLAAIKDKYDVELPTSHPAVAWAMRRASWLIDRFQPGADGMSPYRRQHARSYGGAVIPSPRRCSCETLAHTLPS